MPNPKSPLQTARGKDAPKKLQRALLLTSCIVFIATGFIVTRLPSLDLTTQEFASGVLIKVGFVIGVAWIASPALERLGWDRLRGAALVCVLIVIVLYAIRPRIGAIAGAILAVAGIVFGLSGWIRRLTNNHSSRR